MEYAGFLWHVPERFFQPVELQGRGNQLRFCHLPGYRYLQSRKGVVQAQFPWLQHDRSFLDYQGLPVPGSVLFAVIRVLAEMWHPLLRSGVQYKAWKTEVAVHSLLPSENRPSPDHPWNGKENTSHQESGPFLRLCIQDQRSLRVLQLTKFGLTSGTDQERFSMRDFCRTD